MRIIAFTGMPGSGKSLAIEVAKKIGIPVFRMGEVVWDEVKKQNLEINDENVGEIADEMRKKHGMNIWAKKTLEKIKTDEEKIIIDGIRNIEELELFKRKLGKNFSLIAIRSSPETRHKRLMKRKREDDSNSLEKIIERDERELSWGIGVLISMADTIIVNEGSITEFKSKVKEILEKK